MRKVERIERRSGRIPLILKLDASGQPVKWINWQEVVIATYTDKVKWTLGNPITMEGGTSAKTGETSTFNLFPIVACDDQSTRKRRKPPSLNNRELFRRDGNLCLYCGNEFSASKLTRDHVIPRSKGGVDTWTNCVAACIRCNHHKADRTPEQANMKLLAVPYTPSAAAHLILQNRKILVDQMDFLKGMIKPEELKRLRLN